MWRAYRIHQFGYTLPQIVLHGLALRAAAEPIGVWATKVSLAINVVLFVLLYVCPSSKPTDQLTQREDSSKDEDHSD